MFISGYITKPRLYTHVKLHCKVLAPGATFYQEEITVTGLHVDDILLDLPAEQGYVLGIDQTLISRQCAMPTLTLRKALMHQGHTPIYTNPRFSKPALTSSVTVTCGVIYL